jgi:hypothetical protein
MTITVITPNKESFYSPIPNLEISIPYPIKDLECEGLELYGILCKNIDIMLIFIVFSIIVAGIILTILHIRGRRTQDPLVEEE